MASPVSTPTAGRIEAWLIALGAMIGVVALAVLTTLVRWHRQAMPSGWLTVWAGSVIVYGVCHVAAAGLPIGPLDSAAAARGAGIALGLLIGSGAMLVCGVLGAERTPPAIRRPAHTVAVIAPLLGIALACTPPMPPAFAGIVRNLLILLAAGWTLWAGAVALRRRDALLRAGVIGRLPFIALLGLESAQIDGLLPESDLPGIGISLALAFKAIMLALATARRADLLPAAGMATPASPASPSATDTALLPQRNAHIDALTGLMTRSAYMEALEDAPVGTSLFVIDIDHLREINHSFGHRHGDALLLHLARRLQQEAVGAIAVARSAGDSFAVLADAEHEEVIGARLDAMQGEPWNCAGRVLSLSVSIGQARRRPGHLPEEVRQQAEQALDESRRLGSGRRVCYSDALVVRHDREAEYIAELPHAIARHELELFYQPIVDLRDGRILAEEALLRWRHPIRGLLTPGAFQSLLNHPAWGPIVQDEVLSLAIDHLARTHDVPGYISVNFTGPQLRGANTARHILRRLEARDIPFHRLCVEVTESVALDLGVAEVSEALSLLHAAGVRVALDDFGTGYASLQHLRLFPIDVIKIDRSFVCTTVHSESDADKIARSIVSLGQSLDKLVIAEGIETDEQRRRLIEFGCRTGQGYLFSRPLPESELPPRGTRLAFEHSEIPGAEARRAALITAARS